MTLRHAVIVCAGIIDRRAWRTGICPEYQLSPPGRQLVTHAAEQVSHCHRGPLRAIQRPRGVAGVQDLAPLSESVSVSEGLVSLTLTIFV